MWRDRNGILLSRNRARSFFSSAIRSSTACDDLCRYKEGARTWDVLPQPLYQIGPVRLPRKDSTQDMYSLREAMCLDFSLGITQSARFCVRKTSFLPPKRS